MRLLLDTHIAIWSIAEAHKITDRVLGLIADPKNEIFVSLCSLWEIAIKSRIRRAHNIPFNAEEAHIYFNRAGFEMLDIRVEHLLVFEKLPMIHRDPFDRLIVSQALAEPMRLVTHDKSLARYSDTIILT